MRYLKELRELRTIIDYTVSMKACREVLETTAGNVAEAVLLLEQLGDFVPKKFGPETDQGVIFSYSHPGNKLAIMIEINCTTDEMSSTEEFTSFCNKVALQIANMYPEYVSRNDIPQSILSQKRRSIVRFLRASNRNIKPERWQYVVNSLFDRWISEIVLLEQKWIKDTSKTIDDLREELISQTGEYIRIKRFVRWELGD